MAYEREMSTPPKEYGTLYLTGTQAPLVLRYYRPT